ncbi:MAG: osmoprotectant transport system permease protein [Solirubrobacterales bacterium]|jgi:osmoprotectant transport system permease protein|nr:osmoprotectant transport system permease protein [Solirubrobacterales bacterium]
MNLALIAQETLAEKLAGDSSDQCIQDNGAFCFNWIAENFSDRYVTPTLEHLYLVGISVILGFVLAMGMAVLSHQRRYLVPPFIGVTGILYTIPSVAFFFLLLPITGRGVDTALIALTAYNIQIIYRNIVAGLNNVPVGPKDAGRGMGMTARQMLWKVEFPLAVPEIVAGLRIATVSTVAIATLADLAGGGGLGSQIITGSNITFKTNIVVVTVLAVGMAVIFDVIFLLVQRRLTRWQTAGETKQSRSRRFDAAMARSRAA